MVQASWQIFDPGWPHTLIVVDVVNPQVVWAAGGGFPPPPSQGAPGVPGTVVRTIDGGQTWQHCPPAGTAPVYRDVEAFDPNHAVVLAPETPAGYSRIFRTADGGNNWVTAFDANSTNYYYDSMAFFDHRRGLAVSDPPPVGGKFPILATDNGGATWALVQPNAMPNAKANEAALATGTCLVAVGPRDAWFGTAFDVNLSPTTTPGCSALKTVEQIGRSPRPRYPTASPRCRSGIAQMAWQSAATGQWTWAWSLAPPTGATFGPRGARCLGSGTAWPGLQAHQIPPSWSVLPEAISATMVAPPGHPLIPQPPS
jgi:hypothetical protein